MKNQEKQTDMFKNENKVNRYIGRSKKEKRRRSSANESQSDIESNDILRVQFDWMESITWQQLLDPLDRQY